MYKAIITVKINIVIILKTKRGDLVLFKYRVRTQAGDITDGLKEAQTEDAMISWIKKQGWIPISVEANASGASAITDIRKPKGEKTFSLNIEIIPQKVKLMEKNVLFKQMSVMINAGITIGETLNVLKRQTENKTLMRTLDGLVDSVSSGVTFASAMGRYPKVFTTLEVALVRAGEEGGVMDISMRRLAEFVEAQYALKKRIKSAMTYPSVVMVFVMLVLVLLALVIVPMFRKAFANLGIVQLPALTRFIFGISDSMKNYWFIFPIPFILIWLGLKYTNKTKAGRRFLDKRKLKAPVFGDIVYKVVMARTFRTFATLVASGIPIIDAIEMSSGVADNAVIEDAFDLIKDRAKNGITMSATVREEKLFPPMVAHMLAVGEETGRIDEVLSKIADWYDMELKEKVDTLSAAMEPFLIVVIGIVVGLVVASVFIPLVQAMQQFM